jgi:hypothetical protein
MKPKINMIEMQKITRRMDEVYICNTPLVAACEIYYMGMIFLKQIAMKVWNSLEWWIVIRESIIEDCRVIGVRNEAVERVRSELQKRKSRIENQVSELG